MGIISRQSIKGVIVSYTGVALGVINIVWLFPKIFSPEQFGLTRVLLSFSVVFAQLSQLGITNVITRYFPYYKDEKQQHRGFLFFAIVVAIAGFGGFALLSLLLKPWIISAYEVKSPLFAKYFYLVYPITFFTVMFNVFESYSRSLFRIVVPTLIREVITRLLTTIAILLFFYHVIFFDGFLLLFTGAYAIAVVIVIAYIKNLNQLYLRTGWSHFYLSDIKPIVNYGLFALLGNAAIVIVSSIDVMMLGYLAGLSNTAVYTVAFFIGTVIQMPQRAIGQISIAVVAEAWKNNDLASISKLYSQSAINQLIIGSLLLIGIWINIDNILLVLPEIYREGKYVILFIGLCKLFDMATGINAEILITSKHYRFNLWSILMLVVIAVITNYLLIPPYGIIGAAMASAISVLLYSSTRYLFLLAKFRLQPFTLNTIKTLAIIAVVLIVNYLLPTFSNPFADILVRSSAVTVLFVTLVLWMNVSEDVNRLVKKAIDIVLKK